jgi:hypothetical protein
MDIWEESVIEEIRVMQEWIDTRRDDLRSKVTQGMELEKTEIVLAAIWANGAMDSMLWRMRDRILKGTASL